MELEPPRNELGARGIREHIMIRIDHNLVLLLILDIEVVLHISENDLHNAVAVVNLVRRDDREDAIQKSSAPG